MNSNYVTRKNRQEKAKTGRWLVSCEVECLSPGKFFGEKRIEQAQYRTEKGATSQAEYWGRVHNLAGESRVLSITVKAL